MRLFYVSLLIAAVAGCGDETGGGAAAGGSSGGGAGGAGGGTIPGCPFSDIGPGALMDTTLWVPTDEGTEFFGTAPPEAVCETEEERGFRAEELGGVPVFSITTTFCDWLTATQPSMRWVRQGETVQLRFRHSLLNAPVGAFAHAGVAIGDELIWQNREIRIPNGPDFLTIDWVAPKDFPPCTPMYFHVDNHGDNEYSIVNLDVL